MLILPEVILKVLDRQLKVVLVPDGGGFSQLGQGTRSLSKGVHEHVLLFGTLNLNAAICDDSHFDDFVDIHELTTVCSRWFIYRLLALGRMTLHLVSEQTFWMGVIDLRACGCIRLEHTSCSFAWDFGDADLMIFISQSLHRMIIWYLGPS